MPACHITFQVRNNKQYYSNYKQGKKGGAEISSHPKKISSLERQKSS